MRNIIVGIIVGAGIVLTGNAGADSPAITLCHEDEVITATGACIPLDNADYVGGIGWIPRPGSEGKAHPGI